jgi:NADP-dependent 3-hydroxy acid dehydrogenase YdfG
MTFLDGKVALVTGACNGIGAMTARAMADNGAAVVLAGEDAEALGCVAGAIEMTGGRALAVPTDLADETAVRALVERAIDAFGRIDIAFHRPDELQLCLRHEIPAMVGVRP